jgi:hypothetical protein
MADEKPALSPAPETKSETEAETVAETLAQSQRDPVVEAAPAPFATSASVPKPQPTTKTIYRGGVGFLTASLMSLFAAGGGAYLALLALSQPDLLQKSGISGFLPPVQPSSAISASTQAVDALAARVSSAEREILALQTQLGSQSPTPASVTADAANSPSASVLDTGAIKAELQGISGRVTAIETRLAALDPTGAAGAIIAGLQADIAGLKSLVGTLQQQMAAAPSPAVTFAVVNLAEAAARSGPFMIEFETLQTAMPNVAEVAALEPFARTGVPTRELLRERFAELEPAILAQPTEAKPETGLWAWFKGLFADMIKVQPARKADGTSALAVLERAKAKLDQGDLAASLEDVATISTPPAIVTDWVKSGRKRLEIESRVSAVRAAIGRSVVSPQSTQLPAPPIPVTKAPDTKAQGTNP